MRPEIRSQIAEDVAIMKDPNSGIDQVYWVFYEGQSGQGAKTSVQRALEKAGIIMLRPEDLARFVK
jgi:hypothetical protein